MRNVFSALGVVLCLAPAITAQERPAAPKFDRPGIYLAKAVEKDGEVKIQFMVAEFVPLEGYRWKEDVTLTLGKQVRAFRSDGKVADSSAVLKSLAKPTGVFCLVRCADDAPTEPDFYLGMVREDSVILIADLKDISPLAAPKPAPGAVPKSAPGAAPKPAPKIVPKS